MNSVRITQTKERITSWLTDGFGYFWKRHGLYQGKLLLSVPCLYACEHRTHRQKATSSDYSVSLLVFCLPICFPQALLTPFSNIVGHLYFLRLSISGFLLRSREWNFHFLSPLLLYLYKLITEASLISKQTKITSIKTHNL